MEIAQKSKGDKLCKLIIEGTEQELRELALLILDAIEQGSKITKLDSGCGIKIKRKD